MNQLDRELTDVASRFQRRQLWRNVSAAAMLLLVVGLFVFVLQISATWMHPLSGWILLCIGSLSLAIVIVKNLVTPMSRIWIAHQVEDTFPELDQRLITSLEEADRSQGRPLSYLQHAVLQETLTHAHHNPWWQIISEESLSRLRGRGLATICLLAATALGLMKWQPPAGAFVTRKSNDEEVVKTIADANFEIIVEPGDDEVEKGGSLIVVARFGKHVPRTATVIATNGSETLQVPMTRNLDDPLFGGTISDIDSDFQYHVEYGSRKSDSYRVSVFTYPELVRADAMLDYPEYTKLPERRVEDTRRISVVEGTHVTWEMHLNKSGIEAKLVPEDGGDPIQLTADVNDPLHYSTELNLRETTSWKLTLIDEDGRENIIQPRLTAKVTPNRAAQLKLELARDARVSPLEEFLVKATVSDDYGLRQYGLSYTLASAPAKDIVLGENVERREKKLVEHQLDFEALEAAPDQLLSYYFWAEDSDAEGKPRRTLSDMYFAEVRHFEEIFRQGQQQPGGQQQQQQQGQQQSQNAQDAEQLAELQKQIINATWTLIRREIGDGVSSTFKDDVSTILESQQMASEQLQELGQSLQDGQSRQYMMTVQTHMMDAIKRLTSAYSEPSDEPLTPAMNSARSAYEALLKLRAREHEVVQNQQQQQGGGQQQGASRQRFQQQLQQLQLQNDENRYETQRQAQEQEDQEQTEMRQALSRLRELAQRQQDLNEQLQELQNALEQAETDEEKDEIERQLKRLRDQQEEMLRDTDELMERLDEAQNQEAMQETRDQLEQTREQMRESAESLEKGEVTPALASGTRAQRELEEMREELRRESANQFSEQMREMRDQARELDERQQEIGQQMQQQQEEQQHGGGLRQQVDDETEKLGDALREQNEKLNDLLQEIEDTVREASDSEPLLADNLYNAFEEASGEQTSERLERAAELSDRGLNEPAKQLESDARESISRIRDHVEEAAESVLGDETDALRTALEMLEDLEGQLDQEINQFNPQDGNESSNDDASPRQGDPRENGQPQGDPNERRANPQGDPSQRQSQEPQDGQARERSLQDDSQQSRNESAQPGSQQPNEQQQDGQQSPSPSDRESQQQQQNSGGGPPSEQDSQQISDSPQGGGQQQPGQRNPQQLRDAIRQADNRQQRQDGGDLGGWDQIEIAPITGEDFRAWSDRLRDVEEIVDDPELSAEAARIRERARDFRRDFKRHSEEPKWNLIREMVARPLSELRQEVSAELLRRSAEKNALIPIDRDPVPEEFVEQVRQYYENLGSGE